MISAFGLLLVTQIGQNQPKPKVAPLPRVLRIDLASKDWKPTPVTPAKLARKADLALNSANKISSEWVSMIVLPEGNGRANGKWSIFSPLVWKMEVTDISGGAKEITNRVYVSNGKKWTRSQKGKWIAVAPVSGWRNQNRSVSSSRWGTLFPIAIAEAIGSKRPAISQFIQDASANGTKFRAQSRTVAIANKPMTSYRITGTGGKLGPQTVEIVFESFRGLPVTVRTISGSGKSLTNLFWTMRWNFDSKQSFTSKDFMLPKN